MTKKEKTLTTFNCDECGKQSEERTKDNCFPYEKGWVYIYNLEFKVASNHLNRIKDKHFCGPVCFHNYVQKIIQEALSHCCLFG